MFNPPFRHGSYVWLYWPEDETGTRGQGNLERDPGYQHVLMADQGDLVGTVLLPGVGLKGEHYNVLHFNGNAEVNIGRDPEEALSKLGLERHTFVLSWIDEFKAPQP